jgi:hypothetical protein
MLMFVSPVSVRVMSCAVDVPTVTSPKLTLVELADSGPPLPFEGRLPVKPKHPALPSIPTSTTVNPTARKPFETLRPTRSALICTGDFPEIRTPQTAQRIVIWGICGHYWTEVHIWDRCSYAVRRDSNVPVPICAPVPSSGPEAARGRSSWIFYNYCVKHLPICSHFTHVGPAARELSPWPDSNTCSRHCSNRWR